jgi:hypothetical protein
MDVIFDPSLSVDLLMLSQLFFEEGRSAAKISFHSVREFKIVVK